MTIYSKRKGIVEEELNLELQEVMPGVRMRRKSLYKQEWVIALVLGILVFAFGVAVSLYLIKGSSNLVALMPIFFAGWGFGYIICSFTIRKYEQRSLEIDNKVLGDG